MSVRLFAILDGDQLLVKLFADRTRLPVLGNDVFLANFRVVDFTDRADDCGCTASTQTDRVCKDVSYQCCNR